MLRTRSRDQRFVAGIDRTGIELCPFISVSGRSIARSYNGFPMLSRFARLAPVTICSGSTGLLRPDFFVKTSIQLNLINDGEGTRSE